jgi:hypothetical protein
MVESPELARARDLIDEAILLAGDGTPEAHYLRAASASLNAKAVQMNDGLSIEDRLARIRNGKQPYAIPGTGPVR